MSSVLGRVKLQNEVILVYTHKITPRLTYIFKHIFVRILNIPVAFTTKVEDFIAHSGLKMSYTKVPLGKEFFVRSHDILFEQGINEIDIFMQNWTKEIPCFFSAGGKSSIPYDIFAASFYLQSRYEEYLPHIQDSYERFSAEESLAFKNNFLEKPIIDIWAYKLLDVLKVKFPDYDFVLRDYKFISTFNVNQAYIYKLRGIIKTIGSFINDLFTFSLRAFLDRAMVLLNVKKDPYDTYESIIHLKKEKSVETKLFFLITNSTTYDANISITKSKFKLLIKSISDYVSVGLNYSYFTMKNEELLKKETKKLESIINTPVLFSRQYMIRVELPKTYQNLIDLEIIEDYTMGYLNHIGFRASTCTPFYFYDLDFEIQTPLKIFPFAINDKVLNIILNLSVKQALLKIIELNEQVRKVNGTFVTLFHNELLSNYGKWKGWKNFYERVVEIVKE